MHTKQLRTSWSIQVAIVFSISTSLACAGETTIETYSAIPGLKTSEDIQLQVNGRDVWVEELACTIPQDSLPNWFNSVPYTVLSAGAEIVFFEFPVAVKLRSCGG